MDKGTSVGRGQRGLGGTLPFSKTYASDSHDGTDPMKHRGDGPVATHARTRSNRSVSGGPSASSSEPEGAASPRGRQANKDS